MGSDEAPRHTQYRTCIKGQGPDNITIEKQQFDRATFIRRGDDHNAASRWRRKATLEGERLGQRGGNWMDALATCPAGLPPSGTAQERQPALAGGKLATRPNASLSTRSNCDCLVTLRGRGLGGTQRTTRQGTVEGGTVQVLRIAIRSLRS